MHLKRLKKSLGILLVILYILVVKDIPLSQIQAVPDKINFNSTDVVAVNNESLFGRYIKVDKKLAKSDEQNDILNFNLFGFIKLNSVKINMLDDSEKVYAGGHPVGFSLSSEGLIVVGANSVLTEKGKVDTLKTSGIKIGDIIKEIEGVKVANIKDAEKVLNKKEYKNIELNVKAIRKNKEIDLMLKPALDMQTKKFKMGLWVRDDAAGVGTLTYIRKDNRRFGALGHAVCDIDTKVPFSVDGGKLYSSNIIGLKRGSRGHPGELKGLFVKSSNSEGVVDKNADFGVFGVISEDSKLLNEDALYEIGGRLTARPGKAKIRVAIDGNKVKDYDIEIIRTNFQNISKQKSMVIRVTDKELIRKTGGIVQGMSGSPIIQNSKVVGAVTHVFVNDPKKGFGVYLDWMINE
jgi:stage IV sporulation protein B